VKIDVRLRELQQVVGARELVRLAAHRSRDLARRRRLEILRVQRRHVIDRALHARDQLVEALLLVLVRRWLDARKPRGRAARDIRCDLYLAR